jgi:type II secretion system protein H
MRQRPVLPGSSGFTLVEVMLVMLLIGLLASTVVMNFSGESREERLAKEAERFQQIFQFVAETAMLKQQEWGLYVQANHYGFLYYSNEDGPRRMNLPACALTNCPRTSGCHWSWKVCPAAKITC